MRLYKQPRQISSGSLALPASSGASPRAQAVTAMLLWVSPDVEGMLKVVGGQVAVAITVFIWSATSLSGIIANMPFAAAMPPAVGFLTRTVPGADSQVLFYALSFGTAMGG